MIKLEDSIKTLEMITGEEYQWLGKNEKHAAHAARVQESAFFHE